MQEYELCVIFPGSKTEQENTETAKAVVEDLLKQNNAEVKFTHSLGRKKMAYQINTQSHGDYRVYLFESEKDTIQKINEKLRLSQQILRHLIIKLEDISIEAKIKSLEEPKKELIEEGDEDKQEEKPKHEKTQVTFVEEEAKKEIHKEQDAKKDEKKVSLDQLDEKLDELLESDKL